VVCNLVIIGEALQLIDGMWRVFMVKKILRIQTAED